MVDDRPNSPAANAAMILIARYIDGDTTPLETAQLSVVLEADAGHRQQLMNIAVQRVLLRKLYAREVEAAGGATPSPTIDLDESAPPATSHDTMVLPAIVLDDAATDPPPLSTPLGLLTATPPSVSSTRRWPARRFLYAASVLLPLLCGIAVWRLVREQPVGVVAGLADAQWEGAGTGIGDSLPARGSLRLKTGVATITLRDQVRLSVAGPATIELHSPTDVFLTAGKIVVDVPHEVAGFSVRTRDAKVVDLGTEFGVSVDNSGASEVHVLAGRVAVSGSAEKANPQIVAEGSACRVDESGDNQPVPLDVGRFAFAARSDGPSPYDRWLAYGRELRRDPDLLGYYTFMKDENQPAVLSNTAPSHRASDGTIENAQWAQGRFPGKSSLSFSGADERVKLTVPGHFKALTMWAWLRTQGSPRPYNTFVAALDPDVKVPVGQLHHWSVLGDGRLDLAFKAGATSAGEQWDIWRSTKPAIDWRSSGWELVACTIEGEAVRFYCNGLLAGAAVTPVTPLASHLEAGNVAIGELQIGNFTEPQLDEFAPRNFHGSVDEFGIVKRVMNAEEIQRLYEASKPQAATELGHPTSAGN